MSGTISAAIVLVPTTVQVNQKVTATVTITSTLDSAVTVQGLRPYANYTGDSLLPHTSVAYGKPNLQSSNPQVSIAASGTSVIPFDVVFFAPSTGLLSAGNGTFDVGCIIRTSDGSVFEPTAATVTVNQITFPASQQ